MSDSLGEWLRIPRPPERFEPPENINTSVVLSSAEIFSPDESEEDFFPLYPESDLDETVHHHRLRNVRKSIKGHRAAKYIVDFERGANKHAVTVASMDVEAIDQERAKLAEQILEQKEEEQRQHMFEIQAIENAEKSSLARIEKYFKRQREEQLRGLKEKEKNHKRELREMNLSFKAIKKQLDTTMKERKKYIRDTFGTLQRHDDSHRQLFPKEQPQQIKVVLKILRGAKDRFPTGYYAILVSIRDRVGGNVITSRKSRSLHGQSLIKCSNAFFHSGTSKDIDLVIQDEVELPVPNKRKPYLVLCFELIQVDGQYPGVCVAWSCFPLENPHVGVIQGMYKTPMVRGWLNPTIDQYWKMHKVFDTNIDMWSGNLYFQVEVAQTFELKSVVIEEHEEEVDFSEPESEEKVSVVSTELLPHMNRYHYALKRPEGYKEFTLSLKKGNFLVKAVLNDMDLGTPLSPYFYVTIALIVLCFWGRIYLHYFGQWFFLTVLAKMPDVTFTPSYITVDVNYQGGTLSFAQESVVVVSGVVINMFTFVILVFLIWMFQKVGLSVPSFGSKFVTTFGVMTILDPIFILIVDVSYQRWNTGDAMKLFWNSATNEQTAAWGVLMTLLIYSWTSLLTGFLLYHFLLHIFMNGQIIDIFRRVHGTERTFFIPNDLEVSQEELVFAVEKALRYRGQGGELRRLLAMEYLLTDPKYPEFKQATQHFIIYTLEVDGGEIETTEQGEAKVVVKGKRKVTEIYRQFVQLNNHTLIELFNEKDAQVLNNHFKLLDLKGVQQYEDEEANKVKTN
jgi:hypothetical protein